MYEPKTHYVCMTKRTAQTKFKKSLRVKTRKTEESQTVAIRQVYSHVQRGFAHQDAMACGCSDGKREDVHDARGEGIGAFDIVTDSVYVSAGGAKERFCMQTLQAHAKYVRDGTHDRNKACICARMCPVKHKCVQRGFEIGRAHV